MRKLIFIFLLLISTHTILLHSQIIKDTFTILNFSTIGYCDKKIDFSNLIPDKLEEHLIHSPDIIVVERTKINRIINGKKGYQASVINDSIIFEAGKIAGVERVILGEFECHKNKNLIDADAAASL